MFKTIAEAFNHYRNFTTADLEKRAQEVKGMIETDWGVHNDPVKEVLAGNDMKMPAGYPNELKAGMEDGRLTRADLELCVKRILEMTLKMAE